MGRISKLGLTLSLIYLGLFAVTALICIYSLTFHPEHSEFSGLGIYLIALPWSVWTSSLLASIGYISWYEKFSSNGFIYGFFATLGISPGVFINAALLYGIGYLNEKRSNE
jgi:hypothetical protein